MLKNGNLQEGFHSFKKGLNHLTAKFAKQKCKGRQENVKIKYFEFFANSLRTLRLITFTAFLIYLLSG